MIRFEYEITKYPADEFTNLVYFCTDQGQCNLDELPSDQMGALGTKLNEKGSEGWELVQLFFGEGGVAAFWKRRV